MMDIEIKIKNMDLFKELSPDILKEVQQYETVKKVPKGTVILRPGEKGKINLIRNGRIELYNVSSNGRKFIYYILKKGGIFGDFNLDIPPAIHARSVEDSEISVFDSKTFINILIRQPDLLLKLFKYFFARLLLVQGKAISLANDDVLHRLVKLLIQLGHQKEISSTGELVTDKYTHEQLSQMLGVSRQTITTMISSMQKKGIIKRKKKTFIFNKNELEKLMK